MGETQKKEKKKIKNVSLLSAVSPEVSPKEKAVLRITKYLLPV